MLFLQDEHERDLVDVFVFADFGVALRQDFSWVLDTHNLHGLRQIIQRHRLDAEDVVRVEQRFKVLVREELVDGLTGGSLGVRLVHNLIHALAVLISLGNFLHRLQ